MTVFDSSFWSGISAILQTGCATSIREGQVGEKKKKRKRKKENTEYTYARDRKLGSSTVDKTRERTNERTEGPRDGLDEWTNGRMDERTDRQTDRVVNGVGQPERV